MPFDFLIHDAVRVEYRVVVVDEATPLLSHIQNETRVPGGNGVLSALFLANCGARVCLVGNPIGEDSHGRFLRESLGAVANLKYQPEIRAEIVTPYAILLRSGETIQTLLSPAATRIALEARAAFVDEERTEIGPALSSTKAESRVDEEQFGILAPSTQDYASLSHALERAVQLFLDKEKPNWPLEHRALFVDEALWIWNEKFSAISPVPTLKEIEARFEKRG